MLLQLLLLAVEHCGRSDRIDEQRRVRKACAGCGNCRRRRDGRSGRCQPIGWMCICRRLYRRGVVCLTGLCLMMRYWRIRHYWHSDSLGKVELTNNVRVLNFVVNKKKECGDGGTIVRMIDIKAFNIGK